MTYVLCCICSNYLSRRNLSIFDHLYKVLQLILQFSELHRSHRFNHFCNNKWILTLTEVFLPLPWSLELIPAALVTLPSKASFFPSATSAWGLSQSSPPFLRFCLHPSPQLQIALFGKQHKTHNSNNVVIILGNNYRSSREHLTNLEKV